MVQDFPFYNQKPFWYFPPGASNSRVDESQAWHGTCIVSKAMGLIHGVYKSPRTGIMLKSSGTIFDTLWAFSFARDLSREGPSRTVIVFTSASSSAPPGEVSYCLARIKQMIQEIFDGDGTVVVPAGNYGRRPGRFNVDTIPAIWSSASFPLIVVGAVDNLGVPAAFSQGGSLVSAHTPGVNLACPYDTQFFFSGTSFATPMVSTPRSRNKCYSEHLLTRSGGRTHSLLSFILETSFQGWRRSNRVCRSRIPYFFTRRGVGASKGWAKSDLEWAGRLEGTF